MKNYSWLHLAPIVALFIGCATAPFRPTSNYQPSLEKGPPYAPYDVRTGAGDFGMIHVELRTDGVHEQGDKKAPIRKAVLRMKVANQSSKSISLDPERIGLNLIVDEKKQDGKLAPASPISGTEIAAHSTKDFVFEFPISSTIKSSQIDAFELSWGLSLGNENYNQATGFSRNGPNEEVYYAYDPFFYPYASYGYAGSPHRSRSSVNFGVGFGF